MEHDGDVTPNLLRLPQVLHDRDGDVTPNLLRLPQVYIYIYIYIFYVYVHSIYSMKSVDFSYMKNRGQAYNQLINQKSISAKVKQ